MDFFRKSAPIVVFKYETVLMPIGEVSSVLQHFQEGMYAFASPFLMKLFLVFFFPLRKKMKNPNFLQIAWVVRFSGS